MNHAAVWTTRAAAMIAEKFDVAPRICIQGPGSFCLSEPSCSSKMLHLTTTMGKIKVSFEADDSGWRLVCYRDKPNSREPIWTARADEPVSKHLLAPSRLSLAVMARAFDALAVEQPAEDSPQGEAA